MRAVDTNVLVRLATRDDAKQVAAAEAFIAPGAWVSHLVLAEAMWVLASVYDLGPAAIATASRCFSTTEIFRYKMQTSLRLRLCIFGNSPSSDSQIV